MQKKSKVTEAFLRLALPPLKVAADAADPTDDGRVGIWKAPLPGGTAELKINTSFSYMGHNIKQEASRPDSSAV